jgi:hypothetical protein
MALLLAAPQVSVTETKSKSPRHSPFRNPASPTEEESLCALTCALAGTVFKGLLSCAANAEPLVLFDDSFGSTLALPISQVKAETIRRHIRASNLKWRKNV